MRVQRMFGRAVVLGTAMVALGCSKTATGTGPMTEPTGSVSATIDGVAYHSSKITRAYWMGSIKQLSIVSESSDGRGVQILVPNAFGTGTYAVILGGPTDVTTSVGTGSLWSSNSAGGSGVVKITELSADGAKGTFSFVGVPDVGSTATGTKTVTSGSFNVEFHCTGGC